MERTRYERSPVGHLVPVRGTDGRTGAMYEHTAFVPHPLTSIPPLTGETWQAVAAAGYALGRLAQGARQIPVPSLLWRPTLRREAQSTSALEGTFAPLEDVLEGELLDQAARSDDLNEVLNYVAAAEDGFAWVAEGRRPSVGMLCGLHRILVRGTAADTADAGRVRQIPVAIGQSGGRLEDARFVPMPPGQELEASLHDLLNWCSDLSVRRDPVVTAALAHYQFEALHPFNDGNGRLGRLLIVLQLLAAGTLPEPLLSVSPWFEARRAEYQDALAEVSATGDWDGWVTFFASGIEASAIDTARRVDELIDVSESYARRLRDAGATGVVRDVAALLVGYPYISIASLSKQIGKSFQTARNAVTKLVEVGILRERTGRAHGRIFEATDVVGVLLRR